MFYGYTELLPGTRKHHMCLNMSEMSVSRLGIQYQYRIHIYHVALRVVVLLLSSNRADRRIFQGHFMILDTRVIHSFISKRVSQFIVSPGFENDLDGA